MGLINNILQKLFGKSQQTPSSTNVFLARWEKERTARIKTAEEQLKPWITATVRAKGSLPFTWESGNDEAFVTFTDASDAEQDNFDALEAYIIDKLDIPDAGEFEMTGAGDIYIEHNAVKAKYSSTMKALIDYNEETEEAVYDEEEHDSADVVLFII